MAHRLVSLLVAGALLIPAGALGQTLTVTESNDPNESPPTVNADECNAADPDGNLVTDNLTFHWTFASFTANDQVRIDVSNQSGCPVTNPSTSTYTATLVPLFTGAGATDQWPRATDTSTKVTAQQLVAAVPAAAGITCAANATIHVCAVDTSATNVTANGPINLNVQAPGAPTGVSAGAGDRALNVSWTAPGGSPAATSYMVRATSAQDPGNHDSPQITGNSYRLGGLINGVTYDVVVFAFSAFNNRSAASSPVATGTPEPVIDFWTAYKNAGGVEPGGCAAGSAGALAPLLLPLALRRRRRRP